MKLVAFPRDLPINNLDHVQFHFQSGLESITSSWIKVSLLTNEKDACSVLFIVYKSFYFVILFYLDLLFAKCFSVLELLYNKELGWCLYSISRSSTCQVRRIYLCDDRLCVFFYCTNKGYFN